MMQNLNDNPRNRSNEDGDAMGETPNTDAAQLAKDVLQFRPPGRILQPTRSDLRAELEDMLAALGDKFSVQKLQKVCENTGTHFLKMISPGAESGQSVIRAPYSEENRSPTLAPSGGAADIPLQKFLFRPLEVAGHETRSIADHLVAPDNVSPLVMEALSDVIGKDAVAVVRRPLLDGPAPITTLPDRNFPIIFVPGENRSDLQITPISRVETWMTLRDVRSTFLQKAEKTLGASPPRRGRFSELFVTGKMVNVSGMLNGGRVRFDATMSRVSGHAEARLRAYAMGGPFPWFTDAALKQATVDLGARLTEFAEGYTNAAIEQGIRQRAERLARAVENEILTMAAEAAVLREEILASPQAPESLPAMTGLPTPAQTLLRMFAKREHPQIIPIVTSPVFRSACPARAAETDA